VADPWVCICSSCYCYDWSAIQPLRHNKYNGQAYKNCLLENVNSVEQTSRQHRRHSAIFFQFSQSISTGKFMTWLKHQTHKILIIFISYRGLWCLS